MTNVTVDFTRNHSGVLRANLRINQFLCEFDLSCMQNALVAMDQNSVNKLTISLKKTSICKKQKHETCEIVAALLKKCHSKTCVDFCGVDYVNDDCCSKIFAALKKVGANKIGLFHDNMRQQQSAKNKQFLLKMFDYIGDQRVKHLTIRINNLIDEKIVEKIRKKATNWSLTNFELLLDTIFEPENTSNTSKIILECFQPIFLKNVTKFKISEVGHQIREFTCVSKFFNGWKNLTQLCLSRVYLNQEAVEEFAKYLYHCKLETLQLIGPLCNTTVDLSALIIAISCNSTIRNLNLENICHNIVQEAQWQSCLCFNKNLQNVTLYGSIITSDNFYSQILQENTNLLRFYINLHSLTNEQMDNLLKAMSTVYNIVELVKYKSSAQMVNLQKFEPFLQRNRGLTWKSVHETLLQYCLAMAPLHFPSYVLLWIFDWLPYMHLVCHRKKIALIQKVEKSIIKITNLRSKKTLKKKR